MAQTIEQQAQAIYDAWQARRAGWERMGNTVAAQASECQATLEQVTAHVTTCVELGQRYRVSMDPVALWGADLHARALAKARSNAGRRGVKALKAKYGDEIAAEIVYGHSGQTIR